MNQGLTIYKEITGDTLLSLQVHQKRPGCPTCDNTFIGLSDYTLPFMFTREASVEDITTFEVYDSTDVLIATYDNSLISILNAGDIDYISCNLQHTNEQLDCDLFYYKLTFGTEVYYSEIFRIIQKDIDFITSDISVNGDFATDLSGWTVDGATWTGSGASLVVGDTISQVAPGSSMVKITVTTLNTYTQGMEFKFGLYTFNLPPNASTVFYVPSGVTYTIKNNDTEDANDLTVSSVVIYEAEKVECYNLIIAKNSCNKNSIPYALTGYQDVFIIDAELYEPEYPRNDENAQNGNKDLSKVFLRIDKRWTMETSLPLYEPLVDELNKLPGNDCIYIFNDIWKKAFSVFTLSGEVDESLDIEIKTEWMYTEKCNAQVKIVLTENLVINNACCETIEDTECCEEFGWDLTEGDPDIWTVELVEPFCGAGMFYSLLSLDPITGDVVAEVYFEGSYEFNASIGSFDYSVKGSKFGCDDIIYPLNVS